MQRDWQVERQWRAAKYEPFAGARRASVEVLPDWHYRQAAGTTARMPGANLTKAIREHSDGSPPRAATAASLQFTDFSCRPRAKIIRQPERSAGTTTIRQPATSMARAG